MARSDTSTVPLRPPETTTGRPPNCVTATDRTHSCWPSGDGTPAALPSSSSFYIRATPMQFEHAPGTYIVPTITALPCVSRTAGHAAV